MSTDRSSGRRADAPPGSARPAGFLQELPARPVSLPPPSPFQPVGLHLGPGASGLEVLVARAGGAPTTTALRSAWKARHADPAAHAVEDPKALQSPLPPPRPLRGGNPERYWTAETVV